MLRVFSPCHLEGTIGLHHCRPSECRRFNPIIIGCDANFDLQEWTWTEKYPSWQEIRQYFEFADKKLDIKKDVAFESRVISAEFDTDNLKWIVKTEDGRTAKCSILINALGFAAKRAFPDWKGLENFKGEIHHSSFWPSEG